MMTMNTLNTLSSVLSNVEFADKAAVMAELEAEMAAVEKASAAKQAKNAAKAAEYEAAWEVLEGFMREVGGEMTAADLYESCADKLPEGFSRNKVSYGLRVYWADRVVKSSEGKVNTYTLA